MKYLRLFRNLYLVFPVVFFIIFAQACNSEDVIDEIEEVDDSSDDDDSSDEGTTDDEDDEESEEDTEDEEDAEEDTDDEDSEEDEDEEDSEEDEDSEGDEEEDEENEEEDGESGEDSETYSVVWENWYLSVPLDRDPDDDTNDKATSIYYEEIEAGDLTAEQSDYFYENEDGSYTMYTKFTGFTTSGGYGLNESKYCRTELREYWRGVQDTGDNWSMSTGVHVMESTLKVDFCEGSGQTYVGQIHGYKTDGYEGSPATVKVQWYDGDIVIEYYVKPDGDDPWTSTYDEKVTIGTVNNEQFTIKLKVEDGKLYYGLVSEANDIDIDYTFLYDYVGNGYGHDNYFKTGNYFKHDDDYTQASQVVLYGVKTMHE